MGLSLFGARAGLACASQHSPRPLPLFPSATRPRSLLQVSKDEYKEMQERRDAERQEQLAESSEDGEGGNRRSAKEKIDDAW